jgi:acyl carrier protein
VQYSLVIEEVIHNKHLAHSIDIEEDIRTMALAQADVLAGLKEIVEEVAGIPAASVEMDKNFTDDLDVDSLSMVEVVVAAEERFGVKIPDESVTDLVTVGDAVNFIVNASK